MKKRNKKLAEEQAREYLKNIGVRSGYGQLNTTTTDELAKDRKTELKKAKQASDEKAKETLEKLFPKLVHKKYWS